jgi:hypothetical protein
MDKVDLVELTKYHISNLGLTGIITYLKEDYNKNADEIYSTLSNGGYEIINIFTKNKCVTLALLKHRGKEEYQKERIKAVIENAIFINSRKDKDLVFALPPSKYIQFSKFIDDVLLKHNMKVLYTYLSPSNTKNFNIRCESVIKKEIK